MPNEGTKIFVRRRGPFDAVAERWRGGLGTCVPYNPLSYRWNKRGGRDPSRGVTLARPSLLETHATGRPVMFIHLWPDSSSGAVLGR